MWTTHCGGPVTNEGCSTNTAAINELIRSVLHLFKSYKFFARLGGFCLLVELAGGGSVINGATASSFYLFIPPPPPPPLFHLQY